MYFRNEYWFLSNFYPCKIKMNGIEFECSESLFQAFKCKSAFDVKQFSVLNGYESKALGRKIELREDWNDVRVKIMYNVVRQKFIQNPILLKRLKLVEGTIIEDNNHNDKFWGVCNGSGENVLGKILMKLREEL